MLSSLSIITFLCTNTLSIPQDLLTSKLYGRYGYGSVEMSGYDSLRQCKLTVLKVSASNQLKNMFCNGKTLSTLGFNFS